MALGSKAAILGIEDTPPPELFHIPEWKADVYLRHPTANDRDEWEVYCADNRGKKGSLWRAKLASLILCDDSGRRLFTTDKEVEELGRKSAAAIHRVWEKGLSMFAVTEAEVDQLEKN